MSRSRLLASLTLVVGAAAIVSVLLALQLRATHTATASEVAQHVQAHQAQLTAALGPNTTLHELDVVHYYGDLAKLNSPVVRLEEWWSFDANGNLSGAYSRTTDPSGQLRSTMTLMPDGSLVEQRYDGSGSRVVSAHYTLTAAAAAASYNDAASATQQQLKAPNATAVTDAMQDYVLSTPSERIHVDPHSYRVTQVDELAPDGTVTLSREYQVFDIADGNTLPTPAPSPAPTATATPAP